MKIQNRILLALSLVGSVACIASGLLIFKSVKGSLTRHVLEKQVNTAQTTIGQMDVELYHAYLGIMTIAGEASSIRLLEEDMEYTVTQRKRLIDLTRYTSTWKQVLLVDPGGTIRLSNYKRDIGKKLEDGEHKEAIQKAMAGETYTSDPVRDPETKEFYVLFSAPVMSGAETLAEQKVVGVVLGRFAWTRITEILGERTPAKLTLYNSRGMALATNHPGLDIGSLGAKQQEHDYILGILKGAPTNYQQSSLDGSGQRVYMSHASQKGKFEYRPRGWFLVAEIPSGIVTAQAVSTAIPQLGFMVLLIAAAYLTIYVVLQKFVTKPLKGLTTTATAISKGNLSARMSLVSLGPDLAVFAKIFNKMAESFQANDEEKVRQLEQKIQELDKFAYISSHDLKTPLQGIKTLIQWIEEEENGQFTGDVQKYFDMIKVRCNRLQRLLEDLLEYHRIGKFEGANREVDTWQLVQDLSKLLDPKQGYKVVAKGSLPIFKTQATPFEIVVRNLFENAIKHHNQPNGTITVSCDPDAQEGMYVFRVEDDGPGIPKEYHEKIFGMFETLYPRDTVEGSGMGLPAIRKILMSAGCRIEPLELEKGACFEFTWPKQFETTMTEDTPDSYRVRKARHSAKQMVTQQGTGAEPAIDRPSQESTSPHILLVEDDKIARLSFEKALHAKGMGIHLESIEDGEACLTLIRNWISQTHPSRNRVILLDLQLPRVGGLEILRTLRSDPAYQHKGPVFVLSSSNSQEDINQAFLFDAAGYFTKPLDREGYTRIVEFILKYMELNHFPTGDLNPGSTLLIQPTGPA